MPTTPETRFDGFNIHKTAYKIVNNHGILVYVLVPKDFTPDTPSPIHVDFHGGALILGDAIFAEWIPNYLIPLTLRNNAIFVLPNYRLLPEHTGRDIDNDLRDFWTWTGKDLEAFVSSINPDIKIDFAKLLVTGGSAGGYCALQSAIKDLGSTGKLTGIKAVLAEYPMTDKLYRHPDAPMAFGMPKPPPVDIDALVASKVPGSVLSSSIPPERAGLSYMISITDRFLEFLGKDADLLPITSVEQAKFLPPTFILHGEKDNVVDVEDSKAFVKKVRQLLGDRAELKFVTVPDQEHGFDGELEEDAFDWLKEGVKWVERKWLA